MKVYISGKITGEHLAWVESNFANAEKDLKILGHIPINPLKVMPYKPEITWKEYMKADILALTQCDAIYMLKGWHKSKGANVEYYIAKELGLEIWFE